MSKRKTETPIELLKRAFPDCEKVLAIGEIDGKNIKVLQIGDDHSMSLYNAYYQDEDVSKAIIISDLMIKDDCGWETGEISKPTCPSVLTVEGKSGYHLHYVTQEVSPGVYEWYTGELLKEPEEAIKLDNHTGRWFVDVINIPRSRGTAEPQP